MIRVGSLFAGIGGIDLGLERAGMETVWQVEINPFASAVLAEHWPNVKRFSDVREVGAHNLDRVDLICGGFPCQDISQAGKGVGISGSRSGLWSEYARIIGELRPRYVFVENVPTLKARGLEVVLADLAAVGYDAEWDCIPARAVGAPHRRDRFWLVAYPARDAVLGQEPTQWSLGERVGSGGESGRGGVGQANAHREPPSERGQRPAATSEGVGRRDERGRSDDVAEREESVRSTGQGARDVAHSDRNAGDERRTRDAVEGARGRDAGRSRVEPDGLGDPEFTGLEGHPRNGNGPAGWPGAARSTGPSGLREREGRMADPDDSGSTHHREGPSRGEVLGERQRTDTAAGDCGGADLGGRWGSPENWWVLEPDVGRVAHGVPNRVDRLTALGNAVVPQVAEWIGHRIQAYEEACRFPGADASYPAA